MAALELAQDTELVERRAKEQYAADEAYKQQLSKVCHAVACMHACLPLHNVFVPYG